MKGGKGINKEEVAGKKRGKEVGSVEGVTTELLGLQRKDLMKNKTGVSSVLLNPRRLLVISMSNFAFFYGGV